jgi:DNA-binding protein HU-beta
MSRPKKLQALLRSLHSCNDIRPPDLISSAAEGARVNKQDLVTAVAKQLKVTRAKANEITDLFFAPTGLITTELKRGGKVAISGFGSFEVRKRAARDWRDPRTGKASNIKASSVPAFRASRNLRDQVNKKR